MDQGMHQQEVKVFQPKFNLDINLVTHSHYDDFKIESAKVFQKSLSCILSRNFIECWIELKKSVYCDNRLQNMQTVKKIKQRQDEGWTLDAIERKYKFSTSKQKMKRFSNSRYSSSRKRKSLTKIPEAKDLNQNYNNLESICVQNPEIALSRATVLKQIVDKLSQNNKYSRCHSNQLEVELMNKINKMQNTLYDLNNSRAENIQTITPQKSSFTSLITQEIKTIRKQIHQIKMSNIQLIRHQNKNQKFHQVKIIPNNQIRYIYQPKQFNKSQNPLIIHSRKPSITFNNSHRNSNHHIHHTLPNRTHHQIHRIPQNQAFKYQQPKRSKSIYNQKNLPIKIINKAGFQQQQIKRSVPKINIYSNKINSIPQKVIRNQPTFTRNQPSVPAIFLHKNHKKIQNSRVQHKLSTSNQKPIILKNKAPLVELKSQIPIRKYQLEKFQEDNNSEGSEVFCGNLCPNYL